jgi:hypothetical protein
MLITYYVYNKNYNFILCSSLSNVYVCVRLSVSHFSVRPIHTITPDNWECSVLVFALAGSVNSESTERNCSQIPVFLVSTS